MMKKLDYSDDESSSSDCDQIETVPLKRSSFFDQTKSFASPVTLALMRSKNVSLVLILEIPSICLHLAIPRVSHKKHI